MFRLCQKCGEIKNRFRFVTRIHWYGDWPGETYRTNICKDCIAEIRFKAAEDAEGLFWRTHDKENRN